MNDAASNSRPTEHHIGLVSFALLAASIAACGDLDETDTDPPSVNALASWDSFHLVAVRTYHKNPVLLDLESGRQTGTLDSDQYYEDIAAIGDGEFICLHNQSIDFFRSDGTRDESRSIGGTLFDSMTISADGSTLAYVKALDPTSDAIGIVDLPSGHLRFTPDVSFNLGSSLSLSRDGNLVAFAQGDVAVATTRAPGTISTCVLEHDPLRAGGPVATAFSPVDDKLAVTKVDGGLNVFDLGQYPDCRLLWNVPSADDIPTRMEHIKYSPDGSVVAISVERVEPSQAPDVLINTGAIRLVDAATGTMFKELPIFRWEMTSDPRSGGPRFSDLEWSEAGDRLTISTSNGPVQQWDVVTGILLWSTRL